MGKSRPPFSSDERRRAERRTGEKSFPDFKDMIENAVRGILIHRNFKPLYVNKSFAELFGYDKPEDILALPLIRPLYPLDAWPEVEEDYDALLREEPRPKVCRLRGVRRDGKEIWVSATRRVIDWHGQPAVHIGALDITAQVALEHLLLGNEQLLRAVLEILPVPIYIVRKKDGKFLFVNRKTCLLLQQSAGPMLKSHARDFFADPSESDKLFELMDSVQDVREIEVGMRSAHGRSFMAEIAAIKINYANVSSILFSMNDVSERKKLEAELFRQANTDMLTGLSNRRHFMVQAEQELRRARRFGRALSVIMLDLDHFKAVNDTFGHAVGDAVLEALARAGLESLRESDIMGRLGGEEFAVLLPETDLLAAKDVAERFRKHIAETTVKTPRKTIRCTSSFGVACLREDDGTVDDLLYRADRLLYKAKNKGRNRVES